MTTLEDLKTIAKAEDEKLEAEKKADDEKENPFEKKADDEKPKEEIKADDDKDEAEDTNKAILGILKTIIAKQDRMEKAMETPTDLPLAPKGNADSEDVGADVTTPDKYQSNSIQSGLHDDKGGEDKPEADDGGLKMQEKSHTTSPVERPTGGIRDVSKSSSAQADLLPYQILQKCRTAGYQNLSEIGKSLLAIDEKYQQEGVI